MSFELPELSINPRFTWGPPEEEMVDEDGEPFELYSKEDILAAVDWASFKRREDESDSDSDADNATGRGKTFVTVKDDVRLNALRSERVKNVNPRARGGFNAGGGRFQGDFKKGPKDNKNLKGWKPYKKRTVAELPNTYNASAVAVVQQVIKQSDLTKMRISSLPTVIELGTYGTPMLYNMAVEAATCTKPQQLDESKYDEDYFTRASVLDDPVLRKIMAEPQSCPLVIASDEVLSLLMICSRSSYPWHIRVVNFKNIWILEKADASNIDRQWVSETANNDARPSEDAADANERISSFGAESTKVYDTFTRFTCAKSFAQVKSNRSPFSKVQPRMYCYRRYTLHAKTPQQYCVLVRCEVDSVMPKSFDRIRSFALLEQCMNKDKDGKDNSWRREGLLKSAGSFLSIEYARNGCKISRWTALSLLSDAKYMKIGFVTAEEKIDNGQRVFNHNQHEVLSVQTYQPMSLATQFGMDVSNMWAIVDHIMRPFIDGQSICPSILMKPGDKSELIVVEEEDDDDDDDEDDDDEDEDEDEDEDDDDDE